VGKQVLVATLGAEPQVVTLALDLLLAKGYGIGEVNVVHTAGDAVRPAVERLKGEFAAPGACSYRPVLVKGDGEPVADIVTDAETSALLRTLYRIVLAEKRAGRLVHLSIVGGRKPMAVCKNVKLGPHSGLEPEAC
jgi:CRISPR-associated protein Csx14